MVSGNAIMGSGIKKVGHADIGMAINNNMFKDTNEFNKAWNYFTEKENREIVNVKHWWLSGEDAVPWPAHKNTRTFQWCAETWKMWEVFKSKWDSIKDSVPNSYSYKHKKYQWLHRLEIKDEAKRESQLELFN